MNYDIFNVKKAKNLQTRILYPVRLLFRFDGQIKSLPDNQKLRELSATKPAFQQMLKELLQAGNTKQGKDPHRINPKQLRK